MMRPIVIIFLLLIVSGIVWFTVQAKLPRAGGKGDTPVAVTMPANVIAEQKEPITHVATLSVEERVLQSALEELTLHQALRSEVDPAKRTELESRSRAIRAKRLELYNSEPE